MFDVNARDNTERTPLFCAVETGDLKVVQIFIDNNADVMARDENSRTLLHAADRIGLVHIFKYLVKDRADYCSDGSRDFC